MTLCSRALQYRLTRFLDLLSSESWLGLLRSFTLITGLETMTIGRLSCARISLLIPTSASCVKLAFTRYFCNIHFEFSCFWSTSKRRARRVTRLLGLSLCSIAEIRPPPCQVVRVMENWLVQSEEINPQPRLSVYLLGVFPDSAATSWRWHSVILLDWIGAGSGSGSNPVQKVEEVRSSSKLTIYGLGYT
jgi:hypothetical protein